MRKLLDGNSPLVSGLAKIFDCIMLSLCWITACLPIVTIGLASGALYRTVYHCIRKDEGYPLKFFWETFRKNWKAGILTWLAVLGMFLFLIADAWILRYFVDAGNSMARLLGVILVLLGVALVWAAYCTAYCVRFEGSVKDTLWLSFFLVLSHPIMSVVIFLFLALGAALALMVPFLAVMMPAFTCLAISIPMENVFLKHMRPEDVEKIRSGEA